MKRNLIFCKKQWAFILSSACLLGFISCTQEEKSPVDFDALEVSGGAFATELSTDGSTDINKVDPSSSSFSKTYQLFSLEDGKDVSKVDLYVSFNGSLTNANEVLFSTTTSDAFDSDGNVTLSINGDLLLSSLGLTASDLDGGDTFNYRLALTTPKGVFSAVSANFDNQSADHAFSSTVVCLLSTVPAGDWIVQMGDTFGDGWQTDNGNGGPGITATLSNGDVFEVGLCSPYETPSYDCVNDASSGEAIITIPAGISSAEWYFPGDFYGEISFKIISPSGNVVASYDPGEASGIVPLNLCNE
ncbi:MULTISPECIES: hypothetical protein [Flavobacteriaceae]|uniref:hypothetical protein n=1 Tax=Flavobacteriaceae TaxID=49546 RepID=UPI0014911652|nr:MULTISPECIES: hypothetical protein [Allomuricauda]MDC6366696.1 hypothetical protein [Muricauda sp. AC10]